MRQVGVEGDQRQFFQQQEDHRDDDQPDDEGYQHVLPGDAQDVPEQQRAKVLPEACLAA